MPKKDKVAYQRREFLNEDLSMSAFVIAYLEEFTPTRQKTNVYSYPVLDIADCYKKMSLDFGFHNQSMMKEKQEKLHKFQEIINEFAIAFDEQVEKFQAAKEKAAANRKLKKKREINAKAA